MEHRLENDAYPARLIAPAPPCINKSFWSHLQPLTSLRNSRFQKRKAHSIRAPPPSRLRMSEWTFSLRKGRAHDCDSDASQEEGPTSLPASTLPETARQHGEGEGETVQFQESPWTIAKMNAASRKTDNMTQDATDTLSLSHQPVAAAPTQNAPNRNLELLPKEQITLETSIQRRSERPSAAVHTENAATNVLSKPSMAHHAPRFLQCPQSTLDDDWTTSKPCPNGPKRGELCMELRSQARNTPQQPDATHARTTNRMLSPTFSTQPATDPLTNSSASISTHQVQLPAKLGLGKSFEELDSRGRLIEFSAVASMSSPACGLLPRNSPETALKCPQPQSLPATQKLRSAHTHTSSPTTVTGSSTFVTSLIAETFSQQHHHYQEESQADPRGESPVWWSDSSKLTQDPENNSGDYGEGAVRNFDDLPLDETSVETPVAAYTQPDVQIARFSPYLAEDFSPIRSPPINIFPNARHLEQEKISVQLSPLASSASRERQYPLMPPTSSPSPSSPHLPQLQRARPLSSLPVRGKSRLQRPRISRVDLDCDPVWSTLPSRKRKTPAPNHKGGITTTARFSLPIALLSAGNALTETANLRTKSLYCPPPRPQKAELNGGGSREVGELGNASSSSADEGATGWRLFKIVKDPNSGTGAREMYRSQS